MPAMLGDVAVFPEPQRSALRETLRRFAEELPHGVATVSRGMPSISVDGRTIVSLWGFNHHNSVFVKSEVISRIRKTLPNVTVTTSTLHFSRDNALDEAVVGIIARTAIDVLNDSNYETKGKRLRYDYGGQRVD